MLIPSENALAASLSSASGRQITPIVADVNNKLDLVKVETKLKDDPSITLLVNNAGCASVGRCSMPTSRRWKA
jgi:uncharacterized protein